MNPQEPPGASAPMTLVPPRPNLGPEPLDDASGLDIWTFVIAFALIVLFLGIIARLRSRRKRKSGTSEERPAPADAPADALHALANSVRAQIVTRFGETWRARTTEQIAGDAKIAEALGPELFPKLVAFLHEVDVAKYSGQEDVDTEAILANWSDWARHFVAGDAGARSAITAK